MHASLLLPLSLTTLLVGADAATNVVFPDATDNNDNTKNRPSGLLLPRSDFKGNDYPETYNDYEEDDTIEIEFAADEARIRFDNSTASNEIDSGPECDPVTNICTNLPAYPDKKMLRALRKGNQFTRDLIKSMTLPVPSGSDVDARGRAGDVDFVLRFGTNENGDEFLEEDNVCRTLRRRLQPQGAKNTRGEFVWILNRPAGKEEYIQVVETTVCQDVGSQCLDGGLSGLKTSCRQEYVEHKLLALDAEGKQIVMDTFRFPSCCTCHLQNSLRLN